MKQTEQIILALLQKALNPDIEVDCMVFKDALWADVINMASDQGVLGVCFEACEQLPPKLRPDIDNLMEWLGQASFQEQQYAEHKNVVEELASFYNSQGIKMLLFKGYGLSLNYPVPNRRPTGDMDVYLYGLGEFADQMVEKYFGIKTKQNQDKHSVFEFEGMTVENHARFLNDNRYPSLKELEIFLEKEAKNAKTISVGRSKLYVPTSLFNALFIPLHTAAHFVYGEASLRQLCDWACFLDKHSKEVDWEEVKQLATEAGYFLFLCCLNGIVMDYLIPTLQLPEWESNKKLEKKILDDILSGQREQGQTNLDKFVSFFKNSWKHRLVHNENIFMTFIRRIPAFILVHYQKNRKVVWNNN